MDWDDSAGHTRGVNRETGSDLSRRKSVSHREKDLGVIPAKLVTRTAQGPQNLMVRDPSTPQRINYCCWSICKHGLLQDKSACISNELIPKHMQYCS